MKKYLQNRIATSRWALPVTGLLTALVWMATGVVGDNRMWLPFALLVLTALTMVQLNNRYALIRIYSRMVSCSFLVISTMCPFAFTSWRTALLGLMAALAFLLLFSSYQNREAQASVFFAFVCIGVSSLAWIQALAFAPLAWLLCGLLLFSLTPRSFVASLLGLLLPYWFWLGVLALSGDVSPMLRHLSLILEWRPWPVTGVVGNHQMAAIAFVVVATVISYIHFIGNSYKDKIRTRTFYNCFLISVVYTLALIALQPQHINELVSILAVVAAPVVGHYLALSSTRWSNVVFFIMLLAAVAIIAYNLWTPSLICF